MMKSIYSFLGYDEPRDEVLNAGTNEGPYQPPSLDLSNFDDFPDIPVTISHEHAAAPTTSENADRSYYPYFHTLEVIVADLGHALDAQRHPGQVLALTPAALRARLALVLRGVEARPLGPRVAVHGVFAQRGELLHEGRAPRGGER